jgi:hypothetical protein
MSFSKAIFPTLIYISLGKFSHFSTWKNDLEAYNEFCEKGDPNLWDFQQKYILNSQISTIEIGYVMKI